MLSPVKRLVVISASVGAGAAVVLAIAIGSFLWYSARPQQPQPWETTAIVATFDRVFSARRDGERIVTYQYILENRTDSDYRFYGASQLDLNVHLKRQDALSGTGTAITVAEDGFLLPPGRRRGFDISVNIGNGKAASTIDLLDDGNGIESDVLLRHITTEWKNIDGFVAFDTSNRYEIRFPGPTEEASHE